MFIAAQLKSSGFKVAENLLLALEERIFSRKIVKHYSGSVRLLPHRNFPHHFSYFVVPAYILKTITFHEEAQDFASYLNNFHNFQYQWIIDCVTQFSLL
jgi:hypothetical protein